MGRPSGQKTRKRSLPTRLRTEIERQIERGQCAYCRTPARPDKPLTREHVIPRARGGRRRDVRIIVPACARCNHHRGCRELIPFLLTRPQRLAAFIDYLSALDPDCIQELDQRIFAELYVAVAILRDCFEHGIRWRWERERLCTGRSLHRRRYAARRAMGAVSERIERSRVEPENAGPTCLVPPVQAELPILLDEPLEITTSRLLGVLATMWGVSAEIVARELARELGGSAVVPDAIGWDTAEQSERELSTDDDGVVPLDGWKRRRRRKRHRVDRRHTRVPRSQGPARGRAA